MNINVKGKPYKGYIYFIRATMLLFQSENKSLDFGTLGTFIAIASECDWDRKHPTYGCLTKPDEYLAKRWRCNTSTVWRKKKDLISLGLLKETDSGLFRLCYIEWFEASVAKELGKQEFANSQELIARTQELIASSQRKIADVQDHQGHNEPQSFKVSFKEDLSGGFKESNYMSDKDEDKEDMERVAEEVFGDD